MKLNPIMACDFYKTGHFLMWPEGTDFVYSNFTPRSTKLAPKSNEVFDDKVVFFGLQGFIQWFLIEEFNVGFFNQPKEKVINQYVNRMKSSLCLESFDASHIEALHDLGYLPIEIKALPEGSLVPTKVPMFTVRNTVKGFGWLVGYLEDMLSCETWKSCTTASTSRQYRLLLEKYAKETGSSIEFVQWQGHDFSFRGQSGVHDAAVSCSGHLLSFLGTDTIPAIDYLDTYYMGDTTFVGGSVAASEHSVMCAGGNLNEQETIKRIITEAYPSGIVSIVSDSWDYWNTLTVIANNLKKDILNRKDNIIGQSKVVFRPDSGEPELIICGDKSLPDWNSPEFKGSLQCLWEIFGGTINASGFKELNPKVGLIYGDSITLERASNILSKMKEQGFASSNIVFGIGSYTYQHVTRDSYGFAMKATYCEVNGVPREIFKDPATSDGTKKSAKGLLRVIKDTNEEFCLLDQQTNEQESMGELLTVFKNSKLTRFSSLEDVRSTLWPK
jgi:nicotinamide phosphoribosyltransferase